MSGIRRTTLIAQVSLAKAFDIRRTLVWKEFKQLVSMTAIGVVCFDLHAASMGGSTAHHSDNIFVWDSRLLNGCFLFVHAIPQRIYR